ncbi:MAG TPA: Ni/Fe hydrogenase subunit alpha [Candidatus Cloacimonetes bacterium]|nr:Ni/Fe hydrogenase subunit alpha [Candidatus Cloacimonadota bacterium]
MKTIKVNHLARVEGDGGITVEFDGNKLSKVNVDIFEGPRLIEALAVGKTAQEINSITPRICAICTVSHKNASVRACDRALAIPETKKTYYTRELMHLGEIVESHSLHVFALALPDFLGYPNVIAMVDKYKDIVMQALNLKKFGNRIMQITNGKFIHGENAVAGGYGKFPSKTELLEIKTTAESFMEFVTAATDIVGGLEIPSYLEEETVFGCCNPDDSNSFGYWGDSIIVSDGTIIPAMEYKENLIERVVPHSFAKRSLYKGKPFSVTALGRLINLGDRLKGNAGEYYRKYRNWRWNRNPFFNNLAQSIEMIYCLERIPVVIDKLLEMKDTPIQEPTRSDGRGVGLVEAPRGLLVHDYTFRDGKIIDCNIITPTAYNLDDMEKYIGIAAKNLNNAGQETEAIRFELEKIARSYDPCISCATHLVNVIKK